MPSATSMRDFGRRQSQKSKSEKELEAERRLAQVLDRLRSSLALGWGSEGNQRRWQSTDTSVQLQAVKALLSLAEVVAEYGKFFEKNPASHTKIQAGLADVSLALEALLLASSPAVTSRAASACQLYASSSYSRQAFALPGLIFPLASKIDSKDIATSSASVLALLNLLSGASPNKVPGSMGIFSKAAQWTELQKADAVGRVFKLLQSGDASARASALQFLALVLAKWREASVVARDLVELGALLGTLCSDGHQEVTAGAMACSAALAGYLPFVMSLQYSQPDLLKVVIRHLQPAGPSANQEHAFRLLRVLVPSLSTFSPTSTDMKRLADCCIRALGSTGPTSFRQGSSDGVSFEAARAVLALLHSPELGCNLQLLQAGLSQALSAILEHGRIVSPTDVVAKSETGAEQERRGKRAVGHPKLRALAWEIVARLGWTCQVDRDTAVLVGGLPKLVATKLWGALYSRGRTADELASELQLPGTAAESTSGRLGSAEGNASAVSTEYSNNNTVVDACNSTVKHVVKRSPGQPRAGLGNHQREPPSLQETVELGDAAVAWLCSPSVPLRSATQKVLAELAPQGSSAWLRPLAEALRPRQGAQSQAGTQVLLAHARLAAAAAWVPDWRKQLVEAGVKDVVLDLLLWRGRLEEESLSSGKAETGSDQDADEDWVGKDCVLLAALQAFVGMADEEEKGFLRANKSREAQAGEGGNLIRLEQVVAVLRELCGEAYSLGVRCWTARALAAVGIYGCLSALGRVLKSAVNDPTYADVVFIFPDKVKVFAHQAILAARCPSLLTAFSKRQTGSPQGQKSAGRTGPSGEGATSSPKEGGGQILLEAHVSSRVSRAAFEALLEYVYTGAIEDGFAEGLLPEILLLAKKCQLYGLVTLLQKTVPLPGAMPPVLDLTAALLQANEGLIKSDMCLRAGERPALFASDFSGERAHGLGPVFRTTELADLGHVPQEAAAAELGASARRMRFQAHRVVLAARSVYFSALLRSGMRDSLTGEVDLPSVSPEATWALLKFLYSGHLNFVAPSPVLLSQNEGRRHLQSMEVSWDQSLLPAVELAELAGQWMLEELQQQCWEYVLKHMARGGQNAAAVLKAAAAHGQWVLAEAAIEHLAPHYRSVQDQLQSLPEQLQEAVRTAHVKLLLE